MPPCLQLHHKCQTSKKMYHSKYIHQKHLPCNLEFNMIHKKTVVLLSIEKYTQKSLTVSNKIKSTNLILQAN